MKYSLNDYFPYMSERCVRIEVFPNKETAAKLVADYSSKGFISVQCCKLIPASISLIPTPKDMITAISAFIANNAGGIVFTGIESYAAFLHLRQQQDFVRGLRNLVEKQNGSARILISRGFNLFGFFDNPKYRDGLQLVEFEGEQTDSQDLRIQLLPEKWIGSNATISSVTEAMAMIGEFIPSGSYKAWLPDSEMPGENYGNVTIINQATAALFALYDLETDLAETDAELLLDKCKETSTAPLDFLINRFGGLAYLSKEKAAKRLLTLVEDELWPLYVWMLKSRIPPESYLYQVLVDTDAAEHYWRNYVIHTAIAHLRDAHAEEFAAERAEVLLGTNDSLIAGFVSETIEDEKAIPFLNCDSDFEIAGLIRHAARHELAHGMPEIIQKAAPILGQYLSPNYDYGDSDLTDYFNKLRCFRIRNIVDEAFVQRAYSAVVPASIKKRKDIISSYNDGETALLVVDGMGAEYYPLLLSLAKQNGINVVEQLLVCTSMPSSTQFNDIPWNADMRLQEVKRTDTISHMGYSAHEKCSYEDNLAEIFRVFRKDVLPRILIGLKDHKRVLVTADHGASYLAVLAHKNKMNKTLPWNGSPNDWRYAALDKAIETPDGMISDYHAKEQKTYYIVKGYNRLPKEGGKEYALHGGATLEEMLVPFVVFTKDTVTKPIEELVEQLIENDDFDFL